MTPYLRKDSHIWRVTLLDRRDGTVKRLTTGTRDEETATGMDLMLRALGHRGTRDWDLLFAVADGKLKLSELYDYYMAHALPELREKLRDVDLAPYFVKWVEQAQRTLATPTLNDYARRSS